MKSNPPTRASFSEYEARALANAIRNAYPDYNSGTYTVRACLRRNGKYGVWITRTAPPRIGGQLDDFTDVVTNLAWRIYGEDGYIKPEWVERVKTELFDHLPAELKERWT